MGISHATSTEGGRVVIDLVCGNGAYDGEEIYDFGIQNLEQGTLVQKHFVTASLYGNPNYLRPRNHLGTGNVVPLSSIFINGSDHPVLSLYRLVPASNITSDSLQFYNSYTGGTAVSPEREPLGSQPGATYKIRTDALGTDNGNMFNNVYNNDNIFGTSFTAALNNSNDSLYYLFDVNLTNGNFELDSFLNSGSLVSYTTAAIDDDNEMTVNYTIFSATANPFSVLTYWDFYPLSGAPTLYGAWSLATSSAPLTNACSSGCPCDSSTGICRWGDYMTNVFDYSCDAASSGATPECYEFQQVTEYTPDGITQASNVTSVYDLKLSNDTE